MTSNSYSFPPANASRRRRVAIRLAQAAALPAPYPDLLRFRRRWRLAPAEVPATAPAFVRLLQSAPPLTWLFTGDSLTAAGKTPSKGGDVVSYLTRMVRDRLGRGEDAFITTARPGQKLADVMNDFDERVERFDPDVVVLFCGPAELECVEESSLEFETGFHRLLDALRQTGRVAIINTPPCPLGGGQGHSPQQLVRLEAIRGCTLESSALLVDQWAHWERHAAADWVRSSGVYPVDRGAVELAREFIQELQLDQLETTAAATADPDSAVVPPVPV